MGIIFEEDNRNKAVLEVAHGMMIAARTAPKARGIDNLVIALVEKDGIKQLSDKMIEMVEKNGVPEIFLRDAENLLVSEAIILIGTKIISIGLPYCGLCGYKNCSEKNANPEHPCSFNTGDLGIAIGSAVSIAMEARVDNRIMYTVGMAAKALKMLGDDVKIIFGIPLSCSSKNPFFDRTWPKK